MMAHRQKRKECRLWPSPQSQRRASRLKGVARAQRVDPDRIQTLCSTLVTATRVPDVPLAGSHTNVATAVTRAGRTIERAGVGTRTRTNHSAQIDRPRGVHLEAMCGIGAVHNRATAARPWRAERDRQTSTEARPPKRSGHVGGIARMIAATCGAGAALAPTARWRDLGRPVTRQRHAGPSYRRADATARGRERCPVWTRMSGTAEGLESGGSGAPSRLIAAMWATEWATTAVATISDRRRPLAPSVADHEVARSSPVTPAPPTRTLQHQSGGGQAMTGFLRPLTIEAANGIAACPTRKPPILVAPWSWAGRESRSTRSGTSSRLQQSPRPAGPGPIDRANSV
mmetsp:Transcript_33467/g.101101  ORF Transcript_33467/g.101101 Transcript_33467/m.101101 type:complete len:343 (+) Transcript_33467:895-1923(+)